MSIRSDALSLARGDVRDGIAAIEHFREVLGSRRVGPRMLARAVPEMAAGLRSLLAALAALADSLADEVAADREGVEAVRGLLAHASAKVLDLADALRAHVGSTVAARVRLALEAVVRRASVDLAATLRLVDLLGAPVTSETIAIDFADALHARRADARPSAPGPLSVQAAVDLRTDELSVGDARLLLDLLDHAVLWAVRAGVTAPRIVVEKGPEGFPTFTVAADPDGFRIGSARLVFDATLRDELPHEAAVVAAAARHAGIALSITEGGREVTIAL